MIEVFNIRYMMDMSAGGDTWRIYGQVYNHPYLHNGAEYMPSSPIHFDKENMIVTSMSGKKYKIMSFDCNAEEFMAQLEKDCQRGFEIH